MPNDVSSSSKGAAGKPPRKSMMDRGSGSGGQTGDTESEPASPSLVERAQEMRAGLAVRRQAEALLAEAGELRKRAASDADTMVADAELLANELVSEARADADRLVAAGQERADGILARARAEADEIREEMEQERDRLREAAAAAVSADVERAHQSLTTAGPALDSAVSAVSDVLAALEVLRSEDEPITAVLERLGTQSVAVTPGEVIAGEVDPSDAIAPADVVVGSPETGDDGRPLGWLFRTGQG